MSIFGTTVQEPNTSRLVSPRSSIALPPKGMVQTSNIIRALGVPRRVSSGRIVVSTSTPAGAFADLATVIDDESQDPRTILPR